MVAVQDLVFAAHAAVFSCITVSQIFFCGYDRGTQRLSLWCIVFIIVAVVLATIYGFCCLALDANVGGRQAGTRGRRPPPHVLLLHGCKAVGAHHEREREREEREKKERREREAQPGAYPLVLQTLALVLLLRRR